MACVAWSAATWVCASLSRDLSPCTPRVRLTSRGANIVTPATRRGLPQAGSDDPDARTWRDRLGDLKENGPDGPVGRRNRGPRRVIQPSIKAKPGEKPPKNSNDARIAAWRAEGGDDEGVEGVSVRENNMHRDGNTNTSKTKPQNKTSNWITTDPKQVPFSFFAASTARYPAYSDMSTLTKYEDSAMDAFAISQSSKNLARAFDLDVDSFGDPREYETLVKVAIHIHAVHRGDKNTNKKPLRSVIGNVMRRSIRSSAPGFLYDESVETPVPNPFPEITKSFESVLKSTVPTAAVREITGIVASEAAEWMFGPASLSTDGDVTTVTIKKCRYLEAAKCFGVCTQMCKLPAQDVIASEFGVPLYVDPCFKTGSCRMHFGLVPPSEHEDPALQLPCLDGCASAKKTKGSETCESISKR